MAPPNDELNETDAPRRRSWFPWMLTVLAALLLVVLNAFEFQLNEAFNLNPFARNAANLVVPVLLSIAIGVWWLFSKQAKGLLVPLLLIALPILFFVMFQPVFGGDGGLKGFEARYWNRESSIDDLKIAASAAANLTETTSKDFPQFLGPQRNGEVDGLSLADWSAKLPAEQWKIPIGRGWSGFASVNGYAVTQEQRGPDECVVCYEIESGAPVWNYAVRRRHEDISAMGKPGPRATPTIDAGKVYATSGTGVLDCLNGATGQLIWTADVPSLVGIEQITSTNSTGLAYTEENSRLAWGRSASPLIVDEMVVVPAGGPAAAKIDGSTGKFSGDNDCATLIAFDKATGTERWRGGRRMVSYGSPSIATLAGRRQIVLVAESHAVGHDIETGKELWAIRQDGTSNTAANCSQVTILSNDSILLSKGYNQGAQEVRITFDEATDRFTAEQIKADPRVVKTKLTSPVVRNGNIYSLSDGYLECVAVEGLKKKWKRRSRYGNGQLLLVDDRLIVHGEDGELYLVAAVPDSYQELGKMKTIDGVCWNTLCLFGDRLLVRSDQEAACYKLPLR